MRMWEGGGRLVNRLGPSDQHVPCSVELMTLRARRRSARARLVPATPAMQHCSPLRTATVMMVAVARRSPAGLTRPAIRWAAVPRSRLRREDGGRDPLRTASSADSTPGRRGLERGRETGPSSARAGNSHAGRYNSARSAGLHNHYCVEVQPLYPLPATSS